MVNVLQNVGLPALAPHAGVGRGRLRIGGLLQAAGF